MSKVLHIFRTFDMTFNTGISSPKFIPLILGRGSGCSGIGDVHPGESPHWATWVHFMGKSPFPHHPLIFHFTLISSLCRIFPITLLTCMQVDEKFHSCFFAQGPRTLPLGQLRWRSQISNV